MEITLIDSVDTCQAYILSFQDIDAHRLRQAAERLKGVHNLPETRGPTRDYDAGAGYQM